MDVVLVPGCVSFIVVLSLARVCVFSRMYSVGCVCEDCVSVLNTTAVYALRGHVRTTGCRATDCCSLCLLFVLVVVVEGAFATVVFAVVYACSRVRANIVSLS